TALYGLESLRPPLAYGVHVMSDRDDVDLARPLDGRWIRFWPNPYTTSNQGGPVKDAYERSEVFAALVDRSRREALRVLYVGWTRARDRLVLAAQERKLLGGLLGALAGIDPALIGDPGLVEAQDADVTWAGRPVRLRVRPAAPADPVMAPPVAGRITVGIAPAPRAPARLSPSAAPPVPCALGAPVALGPRLLVHGSPDMGP